MGVQPISVPQSLAYVLSSAGARNGVDFNYLLRTAMRESSLDPQARAPTSSAVGLFQFLEGTWLEVMKQQGPRLGYQRYADAIEKVGDTYQVRDPDLRAQILKLREDPQIAADLAAAFTKSNGDYLSARFGRRPSAGELYIAHFLGAHGAEKMFNAGLQNPDQIAATLFPQQAQANRAIFYDNGQPRTIKQVYRALVALHEGTGPSVAFAAQQMAGAQMGDQPAALTAPVVPSRFSPANMSFTGLFKNEVQTQPQSPLEPIAAGGSAFFTQLYGH